MKIEHKEKSKLSWEEFAQVDIRVGTVIKAEFFEKATKPALKMLINFGALGLKTTSA